MVIDIIKQKHQPYGFCYMAQDTQGNIIHQEVTDYTTFRYHMEKLHNIRIPITFRACNPTKNFRMGYWYASIQGVKA